MNNDFVEWFREQLLASFILGITNDTKHESYEEWKRFRDLQVKEFRKKLEAEFE